MSFQIITDSAANLTTTLIKEKDVKVVSLSYIIGEKEYLSYIPEKETDYKSFYDLLRAKEHVKTSLVGYDRVEEAVRTS
ncbi:MAG: DegV family protein, partial [Clostridia bacterium]|nr:DegV family protein [Clostridia bacterium]